MNEAYLILRVSASYGDIVHRLAGPMAGPGGLSKTNDDERIGGKDRRFLRRYNSYVCYLIEGNLAVESFGARPWTLLPSL